MFFNSMMLLLLPTLSDAHTFFGVIGIYAAVVGHRGRLRSAKCFWTETWTGLSRVGGSNIYRLERRGR
jgi:hypothetical protein